MTTAFSMGHTLTHLSSRLEATRLFQSVFQVLKPGGRFIAGRSDVRRMMTMAATKPV